MNDKKLEGITDITDESNRDAMRITIKLKKGTTKEEMLMRLYKYTDLQSNFNVNNVSLVERGMQPRHLNIKESVDYIKSNRGLAIGNGLGFLLIMFIPIIGIAVGPVLSTVAGTLANVEKIRSIKK